MYISVRKEDGLAPVLSGFRSMHKRASVVHVPDVKLLGGERSGEDMLIYPKDGGSMSITTVASHMLERDFKPNVTILASHEDEAYVKQLKKHLKAIPEGLINVWDDTMIIPGTQWQVEVRKALEVKVAILLVSAAFLASEFLGSNQLPSLLEAAKSGGTIILSVILLPCLFECSSLTQFKPVNSPYKPLSKMSKNDREEVWVDVARLVKYYLLK